MSKPMKAYVWHDVADRTLHSVKIAIDDELWVQVRNNIEDPLWLRFTDLKRAIWAWLDH